MEFIYELSVSKIKIIIIYIRLHLMQIWIKIILAFLAFKIILVFFISSTVGRPMCTMICKIRWSVIVRSFPVWRTHYDWWDWGISLYVRSGTEPRRKRFPVIRKKYNNRAQWFDWNSDRRWSRECPVCPGAVRCICGFSNSLHRGLITYEYLSDRTVLLESDNYRGTAL